MHILAVAQQRYAAKAYDPSLKIPADVMADLLAVLRMSPSSINAQPWHFFVAESHEAKARIASSMEGDYAYNAVKVRDASHVVVFCAHRQINDEHIDHVIEQEALDGRFPDADARTARHQVMQRYANKHRQKQDEAEWSARQVYLALGTFLLAAASDGVDATPMEGFDADVLDQVLDLPAQSLTSLVVVALGFHAENDFNAGLPKSRLPMKDVITII